MKTNQLRVIALTAFMAVSSLANANLLYDPMDDEWEFGNYNYDYLYNPMEDSWSYEPPGSDLLYNSMENSWEYFYEY
tara:strand:+ start:375 stop:605 length:231 start_codon:yes stop_codon:yes gene_type:complete